MSTQRIPLGAVAWACRQSATLVRVRARARICAISQRGQLAWEVTCTHTHNPKLARKLRGV